MESGAIVKCLPLSAPGGGGIVDSSSLRSSESPWPCKGHTKGMKTGWRWERATIRVAPTTGLPEPIFIVISHAGMPPAPWKMKMATIFPSIVECWRGPETGFRPRIGVRGRLSAGMTEWWWNTGCFQRNDRKRNFLDFSPSQNTYDRTTREAGVGKRLDCPGRIPYSAAEPTISSTSSGSLGTAADMTR